jgi:DNA-binding transcriptional LysR family regulator
MMQKTELEILLAVVDHGSFSAAARELGYTPSAVGKRVQQLEQRLKVPLLMRSTRRMTLTGAGRRYAEEARDVFARLTALEEDIADNAVTLRGPIRMTAPGALGQRRIVPLVTEFMAHHPEVGIELILTDKNLDLVGEGVDLAVRSGVLPDSSLVARKLADNPRILCAAPGYLGQHGTPQTPADLQDHRCLRLMQEKQLSDWGFTRQQSGLARLGTGFTCNSLDALRSACLAGLGIAWLPQFLVSDDLEAGDLSPLLAEYSDQAAGGGIFLLRPETNFLPGRERALADYLVSGFAGS